MTNPDSNTPQPSLSVILAQLFSPTTAAALRYALVSLSPLLALFGITSLSSTKVDMIVTYAKTFGAAASAIMLLAGIVIPLALAIVGVLSATVKKQIARVRELAANPQLANEEAQTALMAATRAIASPEVPKSVEAVKTLIEATDSLTQVKGIVTTDQVARSTSSPNIVSEKTAAIVTK